MSTPENDMQHDGVLLTDDADTSQTDLDGTPEGAPLEGAAPETTDLSQTDPNALVPQRRQVSAADFVNQSGDAEESQPTAVLQEPQPRKKLEVPTPNTEYLSIGKELSVQTESDVARDHFLDMIESSKTGRYLTDKIIGVERHSGGGEPRAVLFHGDYKVVIMASMLVNLPRDLRDQEPNAVYHYLLYKRIGSEIDYVIKGIDPETGLAVGSRKEAMENKRRFYYLNPTSQGTYRIYAGLCCEARVMSVIPDGIFVEIFGIDTYIPLRELSYTRLSSAMGYYEPGDRVLVKVISVEREDPNKILVTASVKQVTANPLDKAIEKIEAGSRYAGTVTLADSQGVFVALDMGAECRCPYPYRARPPKGARVIVRVSGVDAEHRRVWGRITYVTIPK